MELAATVSIQGATLTAVPGKNAFPADAKMTIPLLNAWNAPIEMEFSK